MSERRALPAAPPTDDLRALLSAIEPDRRLTDWGEAEPYRYEREVEEFLRWSPSVRRKGSA